MTGGNRLAAQDRMAHVSRQGWPGESLFLQLKEILPSLVHHQLPPGCKDFSEYYLKEKTEFINF